MRNMPATIPQALIPFRPYLKLGEEILFHKRISRFLGGSDLWLLTSQRLLMVGKKGLEEKTLFVPGESTVYHETGEQQFSGNVHLLTNQRVIVLVLLGINSSAVMRAGLYPGKST
jgi:hypothetical protein